MKVLISGCRQFPWSMPDERTGEIRNGVSTLVWGTKLKPEIKEGSFGCKTFAYKAIDKAVCEAIEKSMREHNELVIAEIDLDEKSSGKNTEIVVTDFTLISKLSTSGLRLTPDGAKPATAPAAAPK